MSEPEIGRLREDLEVIRQASGVDMPFTRRDVWVLTPLTCLAGAVMAWLGWWMPPEYRWIAVIPAAAIVGAWLCLVRLSRQRRAVEPVAWREARYGLCAMFLFMPAFVAFIIWEVTLGMPRAAVASSAMFFLGLACAWFAVTARRRRYYAGVALPLLVFGLAIPFCDPRQVRAGAGLMVIGIGLLTAAIQVWQLRSQGKTTDAH